MYGKILIQCDLIVRTGMHIGASGAFSAIGAVDSPVVRDTLTGNPIVPGSSLKGKLRTLLARSFSGDIEHMPDFKNDEAPILRLFGSAKPVRAARLQFADCFVNNKERMKSVGLTEVKFENAIDRINSVANPRQIERVVPGTSFGVNIVYEFSGERAPAAEVCEDLKAAGDYREQLNASHKTAAAMINEKLGTEIVIKHNYSVVFNGFAFEGEYRLIDEINKLDGVRAFVDMEWESPNLFNTTTQVGAVDAWALDYSGEGTIVAILDTGCKVDHPAFSVEPSNVKFTRDNIASIIASGELQGSGSQMNVNSVYVSGKIPFRWNYYGNNADVSHKSSDHGTHVSGIAAGNGGEIRGVAKDAQLAAMQVFAPTGGASWSTIILAVEDCAVLGVDSANLSLGSPCGQESYYDASYAEVFERVTALGVNFAMAAGNDYDASMNNAWGSSDITTGTWGMDGYNLVSNPDYGVVGSPSTWPASLSVASVKNSKTQGYYISVEGVNYGYTENADNPVKMRQALGGQTVEYVMVPGVGTVEDFAQVNVQGKIALVQRGEINFTDKAANAEAAGAVVAANGQDVVAVIPTANIDPMAYARHTAVKFGFDAKLVHLFDADSEKNLI